MTPESVMMMGTEAMKVALALAAPLLLVALITGLIISILQAATQINEMTLSFIPKIVAVFIAIIVAGPWMLNLLLDYVRTLFSNYLISSDKQNDDPGYKRAMAILAASLFLAFAARTGADFNGAHSQRARYSQAGKAGVGNNDYPRYRAVATGKRYAAFFYCRLMAGDATNSDRYCAGIYHAIRLCGGAYRR